MSASAAQRSIEFDTGIVIQSYFIGGLVFAAVGAILSLAVCLVLRATLPRLSRKVFIAIVIVAIPLLEMLVIASFRLAVVGASRSPFSLRCGRKHGPCCWLGLRQV